jgi:membrane protein involved in colicin uptake
VRREAAAKAAAKKKAEAEAKKAAARREAAKKAAARREAAKKAAAQERFVVENTFGNCTELRGTYPHGVGRVGARDRVRGRTSPVTAFKRSTAIYGLNRASDRDGIACEQL